VIITDQEVETIIITETGHTEMYADTEIMAVIQDRCIMADVVVVVAQAVVDMAVAVVQAVVDTAVAVDMAAADTVVDTDTNDKKRKTALLSGFPFLCSQEESSIYATKLFAFSNALSNPLTSLPPAVAKNG
jgi:hypothetical protein